MNLHERKQQAFNGEHFISIRRLVTAQEFLLHEDMYISCENVKY